MTSIEKSIIVHQCHERLVILLGGRKCSVMGFSALLCAEYRPVQYWDTATADQIQFNLGRQGVKHNL